MTNISRENNFDIIRLIAAVQVFVGHGLYHLEVIGFSAFKRISNLFPGVLMFFTISGFLIIASFDRNNDVVKYFYNRILRIYPALWVCFIVTLGALIYFDEVKLESLQDSTFWIWCAAQLTILQFWTPDFLREWGVGTPNGSLWTIPVEIQFYAIVPMIFVLFKRISLLSKIIILIIISISFNIILSVTMIGGENVYTKIAYVSVFPYLYGFLLGSILYLYWPIFSKYIEGKALYWGLLLVCISLLTDSHASYYPRDYEFLLNVILSIFTISLAFTYKSIGGILRGNDLSYGLYIYHMVVINAFISMGFVGNLEYMVYSFIVTIALSYLSWTYVEKRVLKFKRVSAN
jgi:peptidoglycan/LPS O-acetylase OafA/YrhL